MKLIQVKDAARRLGVDRQTVENWGKSGFLKIRKIGKTGRAHYVDADTIEALSDTAADVEHARLKLEQELEQMEKDERYIADTIRDLRHEVLLVKKFGHATSATNFYLSIPSMLESLGILTARESSIMCEIISGETIKWLSEKYGLSGTRIIEIFIKGCRKAKHLEDVKEKLDEMETLRLELAEQKQMVKILSRDLKIQRAAEEAMRAKDEEERIRLLSESDSLLKLFNTRLVDCDLSVRSLNCLKASDIETVGDLVRLGKTDLLKQRNFGKRSLCELEDLVEMLGLSFNMDVDKIYRDRISLLLNQDKNESEHDKDGKSE